eukprot:1026634_1
MVCLYIKSWFKKKTIKNGVKNIMWVPSFPFDIPFDKLDVAFITIWFNDIFKQCIPDFESLLNEKVWTTFVLIAERLVVSFWSTLHAVDSWVTLLFYFCRLLCKLSLHFCGVLQHMILLCCPYMKPSVLRSYNYWNSLDLMVQLSLIALIALIVLSVWIARHDYIGRTSTYFCDKYKALVVLVSTQSQMTAQLLPHLFWWLILCLLIWLAPHHLYASHHLLLFFGCFMMPTIQTYATLRKTHIERRMKEGIDPLQSWLQFWCCRAFILFTYYVCCYVISYTPTVIMSRVTHYFDIHSALLEMICDWTILWWLVLDSSLSFFAKQLNAKIFASATHSTEIKSSSLADKVSLSSINSVLSLVLTFVRPFVPTFAYYIIRDGLYQFLIFFIFLFISPSFGSYVLGYLLPMYMSLVALSDLNQLQCKINLWNSNQRSELITPDLSLQNTPKAKSLSQLRLRKKNHNHILSPNNTQQHHIEDSWSLWSLIPLSMFSFHGTDDLNKNERKRKQMHIEADSVLKTMVNRVKYWVVFASFEWLYFLIGQQIGLQYYVPFWNHTKFALILWMQLPYVPYNALALYDYIILPLRILDINDIDDASQNKDDDDDDKTDQKQSLPGVKSRSK